MGASEQPRWKVALDVVASVAAIAASLLLILALTGQRTDQRREPDQARSGQAQQVNSRPVPIPENPVSLEGAVLKGSRAARIAIMEYADFDCPFCGRFAQEVLPEIAARYLDGGQVLFAFLHLPLERLHPSAVKAAEAAECAARQGKFWGMHDSLFVDARRDERTLVKNASSLGVDATRFENCLAGEATETIRQAIRHASQLQISGTPTFLFGTIDDDRRVRVTRRESGVLPANVFGAIIDQLLAEPAGGQ